MVVKYLYALFIGLLVATFVGVGIAAFYERPKMPEYTVYEKSSPMPAEQPTPADLEKERKYQEEYKKYQEAERVYNRNAAIIAIVSALTLLIIGLTLLSKIAVINDGLLLGGLFTLIYGIGLSFGAGNQKFLFATVGVGLMVALIVGYLKFIRPRTIETK